MLVSVLKSKLHRACVTDADLNYEGSLGVSKELMAAVGFKPYEKVLVANINNGERLETYIIEEEEPGRIVLNGAAAHKGKAGDRIIAMTFALLNPEETEYHRPLVAHLDEQNRIIKTLS